MWAKGMDVTMGGAEAKGDAYHWGQDAYDAMEEAAREDRRAQEDPDQLTADRKHALSATLHLIYTELDQLADFCRLCLEGAATQVADLAPGLAYLESGKVYTDPKNSQSDDRIAEELYGAHRLSSLAEDTRDVLAPAMCLLLLAAATERGMKLIWATLYKQGIAPQAQPTVAQVEALDQGVSRRRRRHRRRHKGTSQGQQGQQGTSQGQHRNSASTLSYVDVFIEGLRRECGIEIRESDESKGLRKDCRDLRNNFAHGDWDAMRRDIAHISVGVPVRIGDIIEVRDDMIPGGTLPAPSWPACDGASNETRDNGPDRTGAATPSLDAFGVTRALFEEIYRGYAPTHTGKGAGAIWPAIPNVAELPQ